MFLLPGSPPEPPGQGKVPADVPTVLHAFALVSWMHHVGRVWLPSDLFSPESKSRVVIVAGKEWAGGSCIWRDCLVFLFLVITPFPHYLIYTVLILKGIYAL